MKNSLLIETISLLEEIRFRKSNTRCCVTGKLYQTIRNLKSLKGERISEPEMAAMVIQELDELFIKFPEVMELFEKLSA